MRVDDDVVRAMGNMVIQAGHLEKAIQDLCLELEAKQERPKTSQVLSARNNIKWCKTIIRQHEGDAFNDLDTLLDKADNILLKRNELIHGQIYFDDYRPEVLMNKEKQREIRAKEIYELAESMYQIHFNLPIDYAWKIFEFIYSEA